MDINTTLNKIRLIDKPKNVTSYDVIRYLKNEYPKKTKIGHTGTLDPFATGLLIILIGKATKRFDEFSKFKKRYLVTGQFGIETNTYDITGQVENTSNKLIRKSQLSGILANYIGEYDQIPPKFSAKKIKGKKAYELARAGVEFKIKPKRITCFDIQITCYDFPNFQLDVTCSSGFYIRSLVYEIGHKLGTFATCIELCRTQIGSYKLKNASKPNCLLSAKHLRSD